MKRWLVTAVKHWLAGCAATALALATMAGCQPVFMTEDSFRQANGPLPLAMRAEEQRDLFGPPAGALTKAPPTVNNPDRPARYMALQEAIAYALENGHVSSRTGAGAGIADTNMLTFPGAGSLTPGQTEAMRVLALNPAIYYGQMEASISRTDAIWTTSVNWTSISGLAGDPNLGGSIPNTSLFTTPGNSGRFETSIIKPLSTGGVANVSIINDYRQLGSNAFLTANGVNQGNNLGLFNPQYSTRVSFGFEQPLLRDFGVFMNELLPRFPSITGNSMDGPNATALGSRQGALSSFVDRNTEGILISRLRFDQARAEFERNVNILLVNTEVAYWNLYNKYGQLYSIEENLKIMHAVWQISYEKHRLGGMSPVDYFQILGQYEEFRGERIRALQEVLDAERNLRRIMGLPVEDNSRIVPITPPNLAELRPDWDGWLQDALRLRPELVLARDNIRYHQYLLSIQNNNLRPDLRLVARYEPFGDGSTLTGSGTIVDGSGTPQNTNAFRGFGRLADWQLGVNMTMPLGWRAEFAAIRAARLELTQSYILLRDQEDKATVFLAEQYQQLAAKYKLIEANRSERLKYLKSLAIRIENIRTGKSTLGGNKEEGPLAFLDTQRRYATALIKEYDSISQYNATLARLEWAKGTSLRYNNIHISEGALPQCAQVRAVEYEKERTRSYVLRERPDSLQQPGRHVAEKEKDLPNMEPPQPGGANPAATLVLPTYEESSKLEKLPLGPSQQVEQIEYRRRDPSVPLLQPLPEIERPVSALPLQKTGATTLGSGFVTTEEPMARPQPLQVRDVAQPARQ